MSSGWKSQGIATAVLLALGCWPVTVGAAPGDHIRLGDAVITPSLSTGFEYHSNIYLGDGSSSSVAVPGLAWTLSPRFDVALDGPDVQLGFTFGWDPKVFIDFDPYDDFILSKADKWSDLDAGIGIRALNKSVIGLRLDDKFEIINTPSELQTDTGPENINFIHISNDLSGGVGIHPGTAMEI